MRNGLISFAKTWHTAQLTTGYSEKKETLELLINGLELRSTHVVLMEQVHGGEFVEYSGHDRRVQDQIGLILPGVDGVYTRLTNATLVVRWADCLPILFAHSSGLIGVIHAGRKGTEARITERVLTQVVSERKMSARSPLHIWLGPCICHQCYQIDRAHNTHYDLLNNNQLQITSVLRNQNLPDQSIQVALDKSCTHCSADQFYSYRSEGMGVNMNYAVISRVSQPSISVT